MHRSTVEPTLSSDQLLAIAMDAGADDVRLVDVEREALGAEGAEIRTLYPWARTLIPYVVKMNREPIRSPARSVANLEFHHTGDLVNEIGRQIVRALEDRGIPAVNPAMGFPMEMDTFPGKSWVISHKTVAQAAGLGKIGIHRNLIHPKFGNFILLGTVISGATPERVHQPIDFNPCLECKLCVAACPVGAIGSDGNFDFSACYTHNYREFMSGFTSWVENIASSRSGADYRKKVTDSESASMWQSLSFGANYKAAYCLAVCPAGDDVIGPFQEDRSRFLADHLKPLQAKEEAVYVVPGSDAEQHVVKRFPNKTARRVSNALRPTSIGGFLDGLRWTFQRGQSTGLDAVYHFTFTGKEPAEATVTIRDRKIQVERGHAGTADLKVTADSRTWLRFLAKETHIAVALLRRKVRLKGSPRLLLAFGRCFPS